MTTQQKTKNQDNNIDKFIVLLNNLYNSLGEEYLSMDNRSSDFKRTTWTRIENFNKIVDKIKEIAPSLPDYKLNIPNEQDNEPRTLIHEILGYTKDIILFLRPGYSEFRDFDKEYKEHEEKKKEANERRTLEKRTALITQLETEKEVKEKEAKHYLKIAIISFLVIALLNISFFVVACIKGWELDFSGFIKKFLGRGIYILTIEVFIAFVGFYFLAIYKSYIKLTELYNSYKQLISADEFFKDDINYKYYNKNDKGEDREAEFRLAYFNMRKENSQKIHQLPERVYNIFSQKEPLKEAPSTTKLLEELVKTIGLLFVKK